MQYRFDFAPIWANRDLILNGLITTIGLSALGLLLALMIGVVVGTAGTSQHRGVRATAATYVEVMRNIPLLVHMYVWYVGLAFLKLPPFWCAVAALTLYSGAYVAETIRAGMNAVPRAQSLAALATGLTRLQALRIITPSLASLASQLIKDSSLASVITVAELTYQAAAIEGQTFRTFEVYITISLLYLALVTLVTWSLMLIPGAREQTVQGFGDA